VVVLAPSRARRRLLGAGGAAVAVLSVVLLSAQAAAATAAAAACALCACRLMLAALRTQAPGTLRVGAYPEFRALAAGPRRLVFLAAHRTVVVWHDATDPDTYRRLAVLARWQPRGQSR
jgi:hypothetical protein